MGKNKKIFLLSFLLLFLLFGAGSVFATEINYPRLPGATPPQDFINTAPAEKLLLLYVQYIFNFFLWISGAVALGLFIYSGVLFLISAGNAEKLLEAKSRITAVFFGLLLLFGSVIVFETINPDILIKTSVPTPPPAQTSPPPESPLYPGREFMSSLSAELPFGTIIEKNILESYLAAGQGKPRMERIKDIGKNTVELAMILKENSEQLQVLVKQCSCKQARPVCTGCSSGRSCTCDPCALPRPDIQEAEKKNLEAIYSGAQINQTSASGQNTAITTSIVAEQNNATEEIRLLKEELGKLESAEEVMFECPLSGLTDLSEHLFTMELFLNNEWFYSGFNFWEKIIINTDWATFYCQVSGSTAEPTAPSPGAGSFKENNNSAERNPLVSFIINTASAQTITQGSSQGGPFACSIEAPVGEIIDRTQRTGAKIIERLQMLINLDEQLIMAVDKLHTLVSQCTSQVPRCRSVCIPVPSGCIESCEGIPCPVDEFGNSLIDQQVQIINGLIKSEDNNSQEGIIDVVQAPQTKSAPANANNKEQIEKIGLTTVIEKVVPEILKDLGNKVREPMKKCAVEVSSQESANHLLSCQNSVGNIGPDGKLLENCCFDEVIFKKCLGECYLESGQAGKDGTLYKNCLTDCLKTEGQKISSEDIPTCHHLINFYCCGI